MSTEELRPRWRALWDRALDFLDHGPSRAVSYHFTAFLILRLLGAVYLAAFISLATQVLPLIGSNGLLPADLFLQRVEEAGAGFWQLPSIFWLGISDSALLTLAWLGAALSLAVMLGLTNAIVMFALWALYSSFVHIGQLWYGYGWEIELLETGFLAIFLCPLTGARPRPPPYAVIVLFRWLAFRIMLGAGLIKLRGDPCWRELTCLIYHYETQPIPNPLSRSFHFMPIWFHQLGVLYNHLAELIAPWFAFGPRRARHAAGVVMIAFQLILVASGNLSFLNWLTIIPMIACFDDSFFKRAAPPAIVKPSRARHTAVALLVAIVAFLSIQPTINLLSGDQVMNTSFDPFDLVNTYGAFGTVGRTRDEIIFEGTYEETITEHTEWRAYEFPCKPGDPRRRPCATGPYQRRLDWQIWFAAMSGPDDEPWTVHLVWKLLQNDAGALSLLERNPFPDRPPRAIRASFYRYRFALPGDPSGAWWIRERTGEWLPPLTLEDPRMHRFLAEYGWR